MENEFTRLKLLDPGNIVGPFRIERALPKNGGMSELYVAYYPEKPDYKVALKLNRVSPTTDETQRNIYKDLLRKEVRLLRELRHPGIVRIYPFALKPDDKVTYEARTIVANCDVWYYAMEYLPGGTLENNLPVISQMPVEWVVELFYQLAITLQYMNRQQYAHCDLKPENIMLREPPDPGKSPQPILIDFGCVERIDQIVETPCATPTYSPPEVLLAMQRADLNLTELQIHPDKIDIWSLGAIFFALLTGKTMFGQKTRDEVTSSVINGQIAKIQLLRPELHGSFDTLLAAMMRKNAQERAELNDIITALEEKIRCVRPPRLPCAR